MDREHPARPYPQSPPFGAKANGPRSARCAFAASTGLCCIRPTKWTASMLLATIRKHWPMLHRAGCKPAFHLVARNLMDREHPARLYPQAHLPMDRAVPAAPFAASTGLCCIRPTKWTASILLALFRKHRPLVQKPMDCAAPAAPVATSTGPCCTRRAGCSRSIWWRNTNSPAPKSKSKGQR
jgi:hypothetical protein